MASPGLVVVEGWGRAPVRFRFHSLDRLRGLAVVLMVGDHVALLAGLPLYRETLGRLAMPLFFVLGGHLARRLTWRHGLIVLVGVGLQEVAPWAGPGPLLLWFVVGAGLVAGLRRWPLALGLVVVGALTLAANGYAHAWGPAQYDPRLLVALMAAGALVPLDRLRELGARLPRWLAHVGSYPLTAYAGHLLLLAALLALLGGR